MWKRRVGWLVLCLSALGFYLFDNNAGTRLALIAAAALPPLSALVLRGCKDPEWDVFGLFSNKAGYDAVKRSVPVPPGKTAAEDSRRGPDRAGSGPGETFQIRPYVPGDPIRQLHWKLSAKLDQPLIRELGHAPEDAPELREVPVSVKRPPKTGLWLTLLRALAAVGLYVSLWGCLCGMAQLSLLEAFPLILGGILMLPLVLIPEGRAGKALFGAVSALLLLFLLVRFPAFLDGGKLLLNRLFSASEARQAYLYDRFPVIGGVLTLWSALLPLGLAAALLWGGAGRRGWAWPIVLTAAALALSGAYLGLSPKTGWLSLLVLSLVLVLLTLGRAVGPKAILGTLAVLAVLCAGTLLLFPGEDAALSAWEDNVRDALSPRSAAYAETYQAPQAPPTALPEAEQELYREEDAPGALGGEEMAWRTRLPALAVILFFALLLFLPAVLSDAWKRRRAKNRAWMDDPDPSAAVRAGFLYALRWLRLGGLPPANVPFSGCAPAVQERFSPALREAYEAVLPLWQEAAYSDHPMEEAQRERMADFARQVRQAVWDGLDPRRRFLARFVYAL